MKRIITALVLIPIVLVLVFLGPRWQWLFTLAVAAVAALAGWEYMELSRRCGANPPRIATMVALLALFAVNFRVARPDAGAVWDSGPWPAGLLHLLQAGRGNDRRCVGVDLLPALHRAYFDCSPFAARTGQRSLSRRVPALRGVGGRHGGLLRRPRLGPAQDGALAEPRARPGREPWLQWPGAWWLPRCL